MEDLQYYWNSLIEQGLLEHTPRFGRCITFNVNLFKGIFNTNFVEFTGDLVRSVKRFVRIQILGTKD